MLGFFSITPTFANLFHDTDKNSNTANVLKNLFTYRKSRRIHSFSNMYYPTNKKQFTFELKTHHYFVFDKLEQNFHKPKCADDVTTSLENAFFCIQSLTTIRSQTSEHSKPV